jgi:hypothetical protein
VFISSDTKAVLFTTNVAVDGTDHVVEVRDVRTVVVAARTASWPAATVPCASLLPAAHSLGCVPLLATETATCLLRTQGDNPVQVARDFAVMHKLNMDGLKSVLMHLKQKALVEGHMKRVFFQQPVVADKGGQKQVLNLTVYEDSDPADLSKKIGAMYGLNEGQVAKLGGVIEREMVARMKLRTEIDMTENGVGMQTLVVRIDETALSAVQRFAQYMAEVGINLSPEGIKVLANRVEDQMIKVAVQRAAAEAAEEAQ